MTSSRQAISPLSSIQALSVFEPGCRLRSAVLDLRFEVIQAFQKRSLGLSNHLYVFIDIGMNFTDLRQSGDAGDSNRQCQDNELLIKRAQDHSKSRSARSTALFNSWTA